MFGASSEAQYVFCVKKQVSLLLRNWPQPGRSDLLLPRTCSLLFPQASADKALLLTSRVVSGRRAG